MGKQLLLINDLPGYGKVALSAMMPVLSHYGHQVFNLPTALVSNTLDYGKFALFNTTAYMKETLSVWKELRFSFDAISTGFMASLEQAELVAAYCKEQKEKGVPIFVDPIMADDGKLYNGLNDETISAMKRIARESEYMVPNYTEACFLTDRSYKEEGMTEGEAKDLLLALHQMSGGTVVITSCKVEGNPCVALYDGSSKIFDFISYQQIPLRFAGTGDLFSAFFMAKVLNGETPKEAIVETTEVLYRMISQSVDLADKYKGLPIETFLGDLKGEIK